jgi:hypothetical protein
MSAGGEQCSANVGAPWNVQLPAVTTTTYNAAMAAGTNAATHARTLNRKLFGMSRLPVREIEAEVEHLYEIEPAGESGESPFIAVLGLMFSLLTIFVLTAGLSFAAYYLAR